MADLVGVRAAARELGLNASTISRNVKDGIIPNHGTEAEPLIDVDEARAARDFHLDPSKRGNAAGLMLGEGDEDAGGSGEIGGGETVSPGADPKLRQARTAREGYEAMMARLRYEQAAGLLIRRDEVERQLVDASRTVRDALQRLGAKLAPELAAISDPAEVQRLINEAHRSVLEGLANALSQQADQ